VITSARRPHVGQSITAANPARRRGQRDRTARYVDALQAFGVVYGVPVWDSPSYGVLATAIAIRTVRAGMPFSVTWW
jgi:hypothetical protein